MDLYTAINQRRTIRDFQDKEIPIEVLHRILNAGLKAPTNDHLRNWEFIVITDKDERARIIRKIPKAFSNQEIEEFTEDFQDSCQRDMYMDGIPKQYSMLYNSSCLIIPLFRLDYPLLQPKSINSLNAFASIWCCIENILLAATAEGLACVNRIPFPDETEYLKDALGHPENYIIPCYLSIGYPAENAVRNAQHEYQAEDKIHWNRW